MPFLRPLLLALVLVPVAAHAMTRSELEKMSVLVITLHGGDCARVLSIDPLGAHGEYRVRCTRAGDGAGRASYVLDARRGIARPG